MFNPETFLQTETTEAGSTEYTPIPENEYNGVIEKIDGRVTNTGKAILDVHWRIDAPGVEDAHERPCRQSIFLDVSEAGGLLMGKGQNVTLNRLREALGQNKPGVPWSPSLLVGNVALISVKNREYEGQTFSDVKGVAPLA